MKTPVVRRFAEVNKEWWLLLSLVVIAAVLNLLSQRNEMLLGLFTLPTLFSAYFYGRRHATLTALASVLIVVIGYFFGTPAWLAQSHWYEVSVWGALLVVTGYSVGTLFRELHETYVGILLILEHMISRDLSAQDHAQRVSAFAAAMAEEMRLDDKMVDNIRTTALMHDITKLGISREIMSKTAQITMEHKDGPDGKKALSLLKRIVPILIASQFPQQRETEQNRLAAQIITVADEFELLTSDRDGREPLTASTATKILTRNLQGKCEPKVIDAFLEVAESRVLDSHVGSTR
jgi:HD domain